ncbi:MAG: hypothetical protein HFJ26_03480 [Clostridia bacterium]|nr:hypothetical protein [Clostridia bacterium]
MNEKLEKKITSEEKKKKNLEKAREEFGIEVGEDNTKYGEFVSSYFAWIPLPEQKQKAEEMQNMTKKDEE